MGRNLGRNQLLEYPETEDQAVEIQKHWVEFINKENAHKIRLEDISTVVGVDLTYLKRGELEYAIACAVLWDVQKSDEKSHAYAIEEVEFPYISGLLAFREVRVAVMAVKNLIETPDLIMFDGHGYAHPRRFGAAVAIGVAMNIPSVGIAKRPLVGGWNWKHMQRKARNKIPIIHNSELVGYAIVLLDKHLPVFISVGYKTDLETATEIALRNVRNHKQPECLGLAHEYLQSSKREILTDYISDSTKN
jgi:deoxyribonuclease V